MRATFAAHGSSKPLTFLLCQNALKILRLRLRTRRLICRLRDCISSSTFLRPVYRLSLHPTFPSVSFLYDDIGRFTKSASAAFQLRHSALSGGLWFSLTFRPTGLCFSDSPVPLGNGLSLTVGLLPLLAAVPIGFSVFRISEFQSGWVPSLRRGTVSALGRRSSPFRIRPVLPYQPPFQHFDPVDVITKDSFLHPSDLRLARFPPGAGSRLGLSFLLCTTPLLASHKVSDDRNWTLF